MIRLLLTGILCCGILVTSAQHKALEKYGRVTAGKERTSVSTDTSRLISDEKIYLHMDKPYYAAGETIRFSGYIVDPGTHQMIPGEDLMFVDLIAPDGSVASQVYRPVYQGKANGTLEIPPDAVTGKYRIRAYTHWMHDGIQDVCFDRPFNILQAEEILNHNYIEYDRMMEFDIHFYPEGGHLVRGIPSRIAFHAYDESRQGLMIRGIVVDGTGKKITDFNTGHDGMGSFSLLPEPGEKYYAYVEYEAYEKVFILPEPLSEGVVLHVNNLKDNHVLVMLKPSPEYFDQEILLTGTSRGITCMKQKATLNPEGTLISIPKLIFPEGVCQLTLYDQYHFPLTERLIFINNQDLPEVALMAPAGMPKPRKPVDFDITISDPSGKSISNAVFSVAITDARHIQKKTEEESIVSYLLLSSELENHLHHPGYYFHQQTREVKVNLDLVMLTYGWRRYNWKKISGFAGPDQDQLQSSTSVILIEGTAYLENTIDPLVNGNISFLSMDDRFPGFWLINTDEKGHFSFHTGLFPDTISIVSKSLNAKGKRVNTDLVFNKIRSVPASQQDYQRFPIRIEKDIPGYLEFNRQKAFEDSIYNFDERVLLSEIMVKGQKYFNTNYGKPDYRLEVTDEFTNYADIFQMMKGRVAGLIISGSGINTQVQIRGTANITADKTPMFILDGIPLNNPIPESITGGKGEVQAYGDGDVASMPISITAMQGSLDRTSLNAVLLSLQPGEIEKIDVLKTMGSSSSAFGYKGHNGVIIIYSKLGSGKLEKRRTQGYEEIRLPGYSMVKEFHHPDYSQADDGHIKPDRRITLFWDPQIWMNGKDTVRISFYNSDDAEKFQIEINGITGQGQPFYYLGDLNQH
ncbi:MAG: hypothetical protein KFF73_20735 [Cyclobacteriaceae bacterium]|nr:hypothetical protein [Cyclobacteriaceae bacterium]